MKVYVVGWDYGMPFLRSYQVKEESDGGFHLENDPQEVVIGSYYAPSPQYIRKDDPDAYIDRVEALHRLQAMLETRIREAKRVESQCFENLSKVDSMLREEEQNR